MFSKEKRTVSDAEESAGPTWRFKTVQTIGITDPLEVISVHTAVGTSDARGEFPADRTMTFTAVEWQLLYLVSELAE